MSTGLSAQVPPRPQSAATCIAMTPEPMRRATGSASCVTSNAEAICAHVQAAASGQAHLVLLAGPRDEIANRLRELALDDQRLRNDICGSLFHC